MSIPLGMNHATERFKECMFPTQNGNMVIDRHDFKQIVKEIINSNHKPMVDKEDSFKRLFQDFED